jgi:hypothetical protein
VRCEPKRAGTSRPGQNFNHNFKHLGDPKVKRIEMLLSTGLLALSVGLHAQTAPATPSATITTQVINPADCSLIAQATGLPCTPAITVFVKNLQPAGVYRVTVQATMTSGENRAFSRLIATTGELVSAAWLFDESDSPVNVYGVDVAPIPVQ